MAGSNFPPNINRRQFLVSAAAVTAASIGPALDSVEAANPANVTQPLPWTLVVRF